MSQNRAADMQEPVSSPPAQWHRGLFGKRWFAVSAGLTLGGYLALFLLLQSTILWQIYSPVQAQFPLLFGWLAGIFPDPQLRSEADAGWGLVGLALYILVLVFLFGVYLFAIRQAARRRISEKGAQKLFRRLMVTTAGLLALLMFAREIYAVDVFAYSWFGRIWAIFGDNPYVHVPSEYSATDTAGWLPYLYWHDLPAPYGPVWLILAGAIAKVADLFGSDIAYHVIGHKLLVNTSYLFSTWLIWKIAGRVAGRRVRPSTPVALSPQSRSSGSSTPVLAASRARAFQFAVALAFAWNPLMLIEFGISGHNDLLMLTCVLLALYLHLEGRWPLSVLFLALAFLIKFTAVIFLPGYLWLLLWRARRKQDGSWSGAFLKVGGGVAIFAATCAAFYVPFWQGPTTLNVLYEDPTAQFFVHSFGAIINRKLPELLAAAGLAAGGPHSWVLLEQVAAMLARWVPLFAAAGVALWQTWPARDFLGMLRAWGWSIFALLSVGLAWYWPWYAAWLLVPALLSRDRRLVNATILLCFTSLTIYLVGVPLRTIWPDVRLWTALWVMGVPLLYVGFSYLRERVPKTRALKRSSSAAGELGSSKAAEGSRRL